MKTTVARYFYRYTMYTLASNNDFQFPLVCSNCAIVIILNAVFIALFNFFSSFHLSHSLTFVSFRLHIASCWWMVYSHNTAMRNGTDETPTSVWQGVLPLFLSFYRFLFVFLKSIHTAGCFARLLTWICSFHTTTQKKLHLLVMVVEACARWANVQLLIVGTVCNNVRVAFLFFDWLCSCVFFVCLFWAEKCSWSHNSKCESCNNNGVTQYEYHFMSISMQFSHYFRIRYFLQLSFLSFFSASFSRSFSLSFSLFLPITLYFPFNLYLNSQFFF